jgi:hypothetical protein
MLSLHGALVPNASFVVPLLQYYLLSQNVDMELN